MGCEKLNQLLDTGAQEKIFSDEIASHIRTCPQCRHGIARLSQAVIGHDSNSCEFYRSRFPTYYEATHPDHPLVSMPTGELVDMAEHLGTCAACHEEFEMFVLLSHWEEQVL